MNKYIIPDVKINIRDLMRYVSKHSLIILMVTCLMGGVFAGYKAAPNFRSSGETEVQADAQSLYDRDMGYYDLDVSAVNDNFARMQTFFEGERNYVNNSIFMQIDPYAICDTIVQYEISADDDSSYAVASYLGNTALAGGEIFDGVAASFNTDSSYIKELIRVTYNSDPYSAQTAYTTEIPLCQVNDSNPKGSVILTIEAYGTSREMSEAVMDAVETAVDKAVSEYAGGTDFTVSRLSRVYQVTASDYISNLQFETYDRLEKLGDILNSLKKQATQEIVKPALSDYTSVKSDSSKVATSAIVKFALTGAFLGFVISSCVFVLIYTMSGKLITADRFKTMYAVNDLGSTDDMIAANIRNYASGARKILIAGKADADALASSLKGKLTDMEFIPAGDIISNADARAKLTDCDGVILAEAIGQSRYEDITEELGIISAIGKDVIGAVIR